MELCGRSIGYDTGGRMSLVLLFFPIDVGLVEVVIQIVPKTR